MKTEINVTQDDINNGIKGDCRACPIVLALRRTFPETYRVAVNYSDMWVSLYGFSKLFKTPTVASDFICEFDKARPVHPFTFEIELN